VVDDTSPWDSEDTLGSRYQFLEANNGHQALRWCVITART